MERGGAGGRRAADLCGSRRGWRGLGNARREPPTRQPPSPPPQPDRPARHGAGGILGQSGPPRRRPGTFLPVTGSMEFDSADLANREANGQLIDTITHEMGPVLGYGTIWTNKGLLGGAGGADPRFTG